MRWHCGSRIIDLSAPVVMGILNVTPDSFSDGGRWTGSGVDGNRAGWGAALDRAAAMVTEGATIIDVGGESTRPGAAAVDENVELERVIPVIERIAATLDVALSVDTSKLGVMTAATAAGACIVNDICALRAPGAHAWAARAQVGVCLMHMQGEPRSMQDNPEYMDVAAEVAEFLTTARERCVAAGVREDAIVLDPGFGFGKRLQHNMTLFKALPQLAGLGSPLLIGVSRKSFIGRVLAGPPTAGPRAAGPPAGTAPDERLFGGLGLAALAVSMGAKIIRTHDVGPTRDAIGMVNAVLQGVAL